MQRPACGVLPDFLLVFGLIVLAGTHANLFASGENRPLDDYRELMSCIGGGEDPMVSGKEPFSVAGPCGGHSIPNAVGMALVDWMLGVPVDEGGELPTAVRLAYYSNLAVLRAAFDAPESRHSGHEHPESPAVSVLAAVAVFPGEGYAELSRLFLQRGEVPGGPEGGFLPPAEDMATVAALSPCADLDGDGFSNVEEWLYFDWKWRGLLGEAERWAVTPSLWRRVFLRMAVQGMVSPGRVPDFSRYVRREEQTEAILSSWQFWVNGRGMPKNKEEQTGAVPPTVTVTIALEGNVGAVHPAPGTYRLPKYHLTDWWARDAGGNYVPRGDGCAACDPVRLGIAAVNSADSSFRHWVGGVMEISAEVPEEIIDSIHDTHRDPNPRQEILLVADYDLMARFDSTPLSAGVPNLAEIVGEVYALYEICPREDYFSLAFDTGEIRYAAKDKVELRPDRIPDYAQFTLLQEILTNPGINLIDTGHVCHLEISRIFGNQNAALDAQLGGAPMNERTRLAVTALMTMGTQGHRHAARAITALATGVELDLGKFEITANRWLAAQSNADGDRQDNTDEWALVLEQAKGALDADALVKAYAVSATDAGAGR